MHPVIGQQNIMASGMIFFLCLPDSPKKCIISCAFPCAEGEQSHLDGTSPSPTKLFGLANLKKLQSYLRVYRSGFASAHPRLAFAYDPDGYWVEILKRGPGHAIRIPYNLSQTMLRVKVPPAPHVRPHMCRTDPFLS